LTDTQLYLAIGIPSLLFALNILVILLQTQSLASVFGTRIGSLASTINTRIDSFEKVMDARFETQTQMLLRFEGVIEGRLKHLGERER